MEAIQELLFESEQLRIETHSAGPQDEIEFWKSRSAKLTLLVEQISSDPCRMTVATLKVAESKLIKVMTQNNVKFHYKYCLDLERF